MVGKKQNWFDQRQHRHIEMTLISIDLLRQIVPPPDEPVCPGSEVEWHAFQEKIGLRFPVDYFLLANVYGSGRFLDGEFGIANPFDPDDVQFADRELDTLRQHQANSPNDIPYTLYPEAGGLYPFGVDGNGNTFLWKTADEPDQWAIVCFNSEDYSEVVNNSLTGFLVLLASNQLNINSGKFWGNFEGDRSRFIPRRSPIRKRRRNG